MLQPVAMDGVRLTLSPALLWQLQSYGHARRLPLETSKSTAGKWGAARTVTCRGDRKGALLPWNNSPCPHKCSVRWEADMKSSPSDRVSSGLQWLLPQTSKRVPVSCFCQLQVLQAGLTGQHSALNSLLSPASLSDFNKCTVLYQKNTKSGFNQTDF